MRKVIIFGLISLVIALTISLAGSDIKVWRRVRLILLTIWFFN